MKSLYVVPMDDPTAFLKVTGELELPRTSSMVLAMRCRDHQELTPADDLVPDRVRSRSCRLIYYVPE
jgi:hypothetical protein